MITFFLSGLWHGAGWTFVIYGIMNGCAVIYELYTRKIRRKLFSYLPKFIADIVSQAFVFIYISLSWVFFRSESVAKALGVFNKILEFHWSVNLSEVFAGPGRLNFVLICTALILYILISKIPARYYNKMEFSYIFCLIFIIILLGKNSTSEFIYFQF